MFPLHTTHPKKSYTQHSRKKKFPKYLRPVVASRSTRFIFLHPPARLFIPNLYIKLPTNKLKNEKEKKRRIESWRARTHTYTQICRYMNYIIRSPHCKLERDSDQKVFIYRNYYTKYNTPKQFIKQNNNKKNNNSST